ncbi:MAG: lamin tail domain-containing protein, partial [Parcubacteria group bacterium]|nr:lamin tail domain-containing protein [Parcubacteria group bacterium]
TPTPTPSEEVIPSPIPSSTPTPSPSPSSVPESTPFPTPFPTPTPPSQIVINEVAWMGTGNAALANDEWLELYNPTSMPVNIGGWRLKSLTDGNPNITLASKTIDPYSFFLLERTNDNVVVDISADQTYTGNLNDAGEILALYDGSNNLQDLVSKSNDGKWYAGDKTTRSSMERVEPIKPGNDPTNWTTNNGLKRNGTNVAGEPINGTPRARNSSYTNKPPIAVADLSVDTAASFFGNIRLTWSSPGDDDSRQSDLKYDLRYATHSFDTITDWENAAVVATASTPTTVAPFANPQSASFSIFAYNADYYFAIKTSDGKSWSDISNVANYQVESAILSDPDLFRGPASPSIAWRFRVPDAFYLNQPAVAPDGTVYFGAPNNLTNKPRLYAIGQDGAERWYWENTMAVPSEPVALSDGAVYFGQFDPGAYVTALNPDGSQRWQRVVGDRVNNVSIDADGNSYFTSESRMITKLKPDGELKWSTYDNFAFDFVPAADIDDDVYLGAIVSGLPGFYKLNGNDGSMIWQTRADDRFVYSMFNPVYDKNQDKFYATGTAGQILIINRTDGTINKDFVDRHGIPTTKVAILADSLVFGLDFSISRPASGSLVYAINKIDKAVIWTFAVDSPVNKRIAVDTEENLYFTTRLGRVYSLDKNGRERWVLDTGGSTALYPILWKEALFVGIGGELLKIAD